SAHQRVAWTRTREQFCARVLHAGRNGTRGVSIGGAGGASTCGFAAFAGLLLGSLAGGGGGRRAFVLGAPGAFRVLGGFVSVVVVVAVIGMPSFLVRSSADRSSGRSA